MIKPIIKLIFTILLLHSCSMQTDSSSNYKIIDKIYSKNKKSFIEIRKYGINSGATVGYRYKFYIINQKEINCFLETEKNAKYKIEWTSTNTIKLFLQGGNVNFFKGVIYMNGIDFIITSFVYRHF